MFFKWGRTWWIPRGSLAWWEEDRETAKTTQPNFCQTSNIQEQFHFKQNKKKTRSHAHKNIVVSERRLVKQQTSITEEIIWVELFTLLLCCFKEKKRFRYPITVLQEAGQIAVWRLETGHVRGGVFLRQQWTFSFIPGICSIYHSFHRNVPNSFFLCKLCQIVFSMLIVDCTTTSIHNSIQVSLQI